MRNNTPPAIPPRVGIEQKHPKLLDGLAAHEDCRAEAARGIHAGSGDVNSEQMNDNERKSGHQAGKA
jgi:hypothetical protein